MNQTRGLRIGRAVVKREEYLVNDEENRFEEAAIEAEFDTGYREETREEARRGAITRLFLSLIHI